MELSKKSFRPGEAPSKERKPDFNKFILDKAPPEADERIVAFIKAVKKIAACDEEMNYRFDYRAAIGAAVEIAKGMAKIELDEIKKMTNCFQRMALLEIFEQMPERREAREYLAYLLGSEESLDATVAKKIVNAFFSSETFARIADEVDARAPSQDDCEMEKLHAFGKMCGLFGIDGMRRDQMEKVAFDYFASRFEDAVGARNKD